MPRVVVTGGVVLLLFGTSGCTSDLDEALAEGCDGLRTMSESYPSDRDAFERGFDQAQSFGAAVELANLPNPYAPELVTVGVRAFKVFSVAAHEPAEMNDGDVVWRGRSLTASDQRQIDQALAACDDR
jgi:hypothetical protein